MPQTLTWSCIVILQWFLLLEVTVSSGNRWHKPVQSENFDQPPYSLSTWACRRGNWICWRDVPVLRTWVTQSSWVSVHACVCWVLWACWYPVQVPSIHHVYIQSCWCCSDDTLMLILQHSVEQREGSHEFCRVPACASLEARTLVAMQSSNFRPDLVIVAFTLRCVPLTLFIFFTRFA